ncbi:hypothetical protein ACFQE0_00680 [Methylobacterium komagatae]|uniref:HK97 gp10 family phage protein n=1 Tax=Methylobacterium komagatae TaxID=374425 RepID=A0ABW2BEA3_9HYPH
MFNFYQAVERRVKEKAAEAKRLKEIQEKTDDTAIQFYQGIESYATNTGKATVTQRYRTITITKPDESYMNVVISEGPTFRREVGGGAVKRSIVDDVRDGTPTTSVREIEDAVVDWLDTP